MNLPTTTEEIEALFRKHWTDKEALKDIRPLYQLASKSEYINGCAAGVFQTISQGITLGGINPAPVFSVILMGFRLGCLWSAAHQQYSPPEKDTEPTKEDLATKAYLQWLEENPTPKEEGESE